MNQMHKFALALLLVPTVFLPGCGLVDWVKEKFGSKKVSLSGQVLVTMRGKPVITTDSFEKEFDQLIEENPHLKSVIALMPDAKKNFLMGMVNQEAVDAWVTEKGVDRKVEYQKEYERMMRSVKRMLNTKYFGQEHPVQVSEAEVTEFYDKNKDSMPDLVVSRGGVRAVGVSFEKEADAKAFVARVKETRNITSAANAARVNKNLRDFKMVNSQSVGLDPVLRDAIVAIATVPSTQVVKVSDKSFWVVSATEKEDAKYRPLEQVKAGLEQYVAKEKRMQMFDTEIQKLKNEYNVVVNEEVLATKEQHAQADIQPADAVVAQASEVQEEAAQAKTA